MDIVVTGIGVVLPGCDDRRTLWKHLHGAESQLTISSVPGMREVFPMGRVEAPKPAEFAAEVPERFFAGYPRPMKIYLASVLRAVRDAALPLDASSPARVGLFDGTSRDTFVHWQDRLQELSNSDAAPLGTRDLMFGTPGQSAAIAAALLKVEGPVLTFSNSCSSGAVAIGHAYRELERGDIDIALATGHDAALNDTIYKMYVSAGLLSEERVDPRRALRPYGGDSRNVFGEGAVTLVLERRDHAERRGATPLAELTGYAYGNSGRHPTDVDLSGSRQARLIEGLLARADVDRARIGVVVGHGNGVPQSDASERNLMDRVFGPRAPETPLVSVKPIYGHLLGASSALNVAAAALMVHHGALVPTLNAPESAQARPGARSAGSPGAALALSYGLGGHNTAVLVRRVERHVAAIAPLDSTP